LITVVSLLTKLGISIEKMHLKAQNSSNLIAP